MDRLNARFSGLSHVRDDISFSISLNGLTHVSLSVSVSVATHFRLKVLT